MVEIISKRDGPRREEAALRKLLADNRATITRLADHFSAGAYSASKSPKPKLKASGVIIHDLTPHASPEAPLARVRISLNGRVVLVDENCGRQLEHLGEIRSRNGQDVFALATRENGFFEPVDDSLAAALADLDQQPLHGVDPEDWLATEIGRRLHIV